VDPELRAFLETRFAETQKAMDTIRQQTTQQLDAVEQRLTAKVGAVDAKVGAVDVKVGALEAKVGALEAKVAGVDAKVGALEAKVVGVDAKVAASRQEAAAARSEARVLHEDTMKAIGTVIDGLNLLRTAVEVRAEDRERDLMNRHVGPLEASAANHERRITALEEQGTR